MSDEPGIAKIARWYDDAIEHGTDDLPAAIDYVGRLLAALAYEDSVLLTAKDAELAEPRQERGTRRGGRWRNTVDIRRRVAMQITRTRSPRWFAKATTVSADGSASHGGRTGRRRAISTTKQRDQASGSARTTMQSLEEIRAHVIALKRKRVLMTGHRAMLARCLDEIDALAAALAEARHMADNLAYNLDLVRRQLADVERERTDAYTQISGLRDDLRAVEAREAAARRALEDVEGKLLYCPPRKCLPCVAGLACEGAPTCDLRERNHAEALAIVRAALAAKPDGETR